MPGTVAFAFASHTGDVRLELQRLARNVAGRLEQVPLVLPGDGSEDPTTTRPRGVIAVVNTRRDKRPREAE
jgi:hypothetical protein